MIATIVVLVAIALVGAYPVPAVLALVLLGVTSQVLGLSLQTRLMDVSPAAPSLGAALCHSALNLGNAAGAFVGRPGHRRPGSATWRPRGSEPALTALGLVVVLVVRARRCAGARQRRRVPKIERVISRPS